MLFAKVARLILESQNFEIAEAEDGQEALDLCAEKTPDVILLDWHMPGMGAHGIPDSYSLVTREEAPLHRLLYD